MVSLTTRVQELKYWHVKRPIEKIKLDIIWKLPKWVIYWSVIRAATMVEPNEYPAEVTAEQMLKHLDGVEYERHVSSQRWSSEPDEPGFYKYDGGNQNMLFHRDLTGQWRVWFDTGECSPCDFRYIDQALSVWKLERIM